MPKFLPNPLDPRRPASSWQVMEMLGLKPTQHLPKEGMPPRILHGIKVWVAPLPDRDPGRRWFKRSTHRVLAQCPVCTQVLSVGRLAQHRCDD